MEMEQSKRKSQEEIFAESFSKYQIKALKPLQKRVKVLEGYIELLAKYNWNTELPEEVAEVHKENGTYDTEMHFEGELKAIKEMIRRIEGKPIRYDDRPEQQLYYEIEQSISDIIKREVGRHKLGDYNETYYEVRKRVAKRISNYNPIGFEYTIEDVSTWIVKYIKEVKAQYPEFYKEG